VNSKPRARVNRTRKGRRRGGKAAAGAASRELMTVKGDLRTCVDHVSRLERRLLRLEDELFRLRERIRE
jgi:hypothetical protein